MGAKVSSIYAKTSAIRKAADLIEHDRTFGTRLARVAFDTFNSALSSKKPIDVSTFNTRAKSDMSKPMKKLQTKIKSEVKAVKKAVKAVKKAAKAKPQQSVQGQIRHEMQKAGVLQNTVHNAKQTYFRENGPRHNKKRPQCQNYEGREFLQTIKFNDVCGGGTLIRGGTILSLQIQPRKIKSQFLKNQAKFFEKYRFNSFVIEWRPAGANTIEGSAIGAWDLDPADELSIDPNQNFLSLISEPRLKTLCYYKPQRFSMPTGSTGTSGDNGFFCSEGAEIRLVDQCTFNLLVDVPAANTSSGSLANTLLGDLTIKYDIDMWQRINEATGDNSISSAVSPNGAKTAANPLGVTMPPIWCDDSANENIGYFYNSVSGNNGIFVDKSIQAVIVTVNSRLTSGTIGAPVITNPTASANVYFPDGTVSLKRICVPAARIYTTDVALSNSYSSPTNTVAAGFMQTYFAYNLTSEDGFGLEFYYGAGTSPVLANTLCVVTPVQFTPTSLTSKHPEKKMAMMLRDMQTLAARMGIDNTISKQVDSLIHTKARGVSEPQKLLETDRKHEADDPERRVITMDSRSIGSGDDVLPSAKGPVEQVATTTGRRQHAWTGDDYIVVPRSPTDQRFPPEQERELQRQSALSVQRNVAPIGTFSSSGRSASTKG